MSLEDAAKEFMSAYIEQTNSKKPFIKKWRFPKQPGRRVVVVAFYEQDNPNHQESKSIRFGDIRGHVRSDHSILVATAACPCCDK